MSERRTYSTQEAANLFRCTRGRINQICAAEGIGKLVLGRVRVLDDADKRKIAAFFQSLKVKHGKRILALDRIKSGR